MIAHRSCLALPGSQSMETGPQARYLRAALFLLSVRTATFDPVPTLDFDRLIGWPPRAFTTSMITAIVNHNTLSSPPPSRHPQAGLSTLNSKSHCVLFCCMYLYARSLSPMVYASQRVAFVRPLVRLQAIPLVYSPASGIPVQGPPTMSPATPNSPVKFMDPQTGPSSPSKPIEPRRRRAGRSQDPPPTIENTSMIICGWVGCGEHLTYERGEISDHINTVHKGETQYVTCQWVVPGRGPCEGRMKRNHLRRHTLDLHTNLINSVCEGCGESQRTDLMARHKRTCERFKDKDADQTDG